MKYVAMVASAMLGLSACATGGDETGLDSPLPAAAGRADSALESAPLYLTGAFDGSQSFRMWHATVDYARDFKRRFGKDLHFTYFINTCFYDTTVTRSDIGRAQSQNEVIARFALTQQAINEGHEIGSHAVRHKDGGSWTEAQWRSELEEFDALAESNLFEPIYDTSGEAVFPRWRPLASAAAGALGAACTVDADCGSGQCVEHAPGRAFCSKGCNRNMACPSGMVCGQPTWNDSQDMCIMLPQFPVVHNGETLFDAQGRPNPNATALRSYQMRGFRAPLLANNRHLFDVLESLDYVYDTSHIIPPGPPNRVKRDGMTWSTMYEFPLMRYTTAYGASAGSLTVPMDYNYFVNQTNTSNQDAFTRMRDDYRRSIVAAYPHRRPWNIGHHFSLWKGGAYWRAMQDAFDYAASGCPSASGTIQCENVEFPSFIELASLLDETASGRSDGASLFDWDGLENEPYTTTGTLPDPSDDWAEDLHVE